MRRTSLALILLLVTYPSFADESREKAIHDATVLVDEGKVDQAIAALKKLVADDPSDSTAAYELGLAYASKGDNASCRATLDPIADAKGPNQVKALGMLGNCLDQLGESDKAVAVYRHGLELDPDDSGTLFNLAITLIQHGKADEGRELLKHDIEKNPSHASAHLVLGQVFEAQGFNIPAMFSFLHFLALEPATKRSTMAADHLTKLLGTGYKKTKAGANITFDVNARKEEGDYTSMQLMFSLVAASPVAKKKQTDFEAAQAQAAGVLAMFVESAGKDHDDFTSRVQAPFFTSMTEAKLTDVFAGIALSTLNLAGTKEWAKAHDKEITAYFDWIRPQLTRPGVILPKK
jgi:tetratricopeptide (TPR) repeat protein